MSNKKTARNVIEKNRTARQQIAGYTYPSTPGVHNIVLLFKKYTFQDTSGTVYPRTNPTTDSVVVLPLPSNIQDSYNIQVGSYELGSAGKIAADTAANMQGSQLNDVVGGIDSTIAKSIDLANRAGAKTQNQSLGKSVTDVLTGVNVASSFFLRNAFDSLGGENIEAGFSTGTGTAINPHAALRFDGVDLKNHSFTWSLSPQNEEESESIRNIINLVKNRSLPSYNNSTDSDVFSRALLNYPDLVQIYFTGVNPNYFFYFKPAMISNIEVDYTPNGIALNRGGRPSFINMSINLTEARIHTREE